MQGSLTRYLPRMLQSDWSESPKYGIIWFWLVSSQDMNVNFVLFRLTKCVFD